MTQSSVSAGQERLQAAISSIGNIVVAFSGGVDSSVVVEAAYRTLGPDQTLAVTAVSPSLARRELEAARSLAAARGWSHRTVGTHEVNRPEYVRNDPDRCYWCKTELFEVLAPVARERSATIAVGTNLDDLGDRRPGQRAANEREIAAPLVEASLSKAEVRRLAHAFGLPVAEKPASPCLASRFAYGVRVTPEGLRRIDRAEEIVRSFGFEVFRVRDHGDLARLEVEGDEIARAAELSEELSGALKELGYTYVSLDLEGFRSGALNEVLPSPTMRRSP